MTRLLFLCGLLFCCHALGTDWYAAPNAAGTGNGSIANPWPLQMALTNTANIQPGDTLWMLGGTYGSGSNKFGCLLVGTSNAPIVVRQFPGQRAVVDGGITTRSMGWVTFWGFEITCSNARTNTSANRPPGLVLTDTSYKAINMVLHDTGHPCVQGTPGEVYGCIIWGTGIYYYDNVTYFPTNPWTRGAGMYLQNGTGRPILVSDNISGRNFTEGMQAYAENGFADGFVFNGNIVFGNNVAGILIENLKHSVTNATVVNNAVYRSGHTSMGYYPSEQLSQHYNLIYSNNYEVGSPGSGTSLLWLRRWRNIFMHGNTLVTTSQTNEWFAGSGVGLGSGGKFIDLYPMTNSPLVYQINRNAYYGGVEWGANWYDFSGTNYGVFYHTYQPFRYNANSVYPVDSTNGPISFAAWTNSHSFDINSTYSTNLPTTNVIVVRTNKYEPGRAHIAVFNWESNSTVNVDISLLGLTQGQSFEVRDVQDYLGKPVLVTNYSAANPNVSIPLTLTNVTAVGGGVEKCFVYNPNIHTAPLFNAFVILPLASGAKLLPVTRLRDVP